MTWSTRREFLTLTGAALAVGAGASNSLGETTKMFGLITRFKASAGQRDALIEILVEGTADMQAMARGRPLIAGFGARFETEPAGGHGLLPAA